MQFTDVYFGTYTGGRGLSRGIYHANFDPLDGKLSEADLVFETPNPSFIEIHPGGRYLYSVSEERNGEVAAFEINRADGGLKLLNRVSSEGEYPCHVCISNDGRVLLVANYGSGTVVSIPLKPDGSLSRPASVVRHHGSSVNPKRQEAAHAHSVNLSPDNRFAYVADLGIDKLIGYGLDTATGKLDSTVRFEVNLRAGAGPRHFTFSPGAKFAYLINELDSTVSAFKFDPVLGGLSEIQTVSILPDGFSGENTCAEIAVHPSGKFLYGSNRGHDSIAILGISPGNGTLSLIGFQCSGISNPRNFRIDPSGRFCLVANQGSDSVAVFGIDQEKGLLNSESGTAKVGRPTCVRFL